MEIRKYNKIQLLAFIESEFFKNSKVLPISTHRALSHIANPRAKDDDVLLWTVCIEDEILGYLGVLPDDIFIGTDTEIEHVGWMSCLWVNPNHRGKKIAQQLTQSCFESWSGNILLTEFTAEAGKLYQKIGLFIPLTTLRGCRWYIHSNLQHILPIKFASLTNVRPLLKMVDKMLHGFEFLRDVMVTISNQDYQFFITDTVGAETKMLITNGKGFFARSGIELQWILDYPWILDTDDIKDEKDRYHFSSFEQSFACRAVEIKTKNGALVGFILFTCRNGHLRIPYVFYTDLASITACVTHLLRLYKAHTFSVYQNEIIEPLKKELPSFIPHKTIKREYLISSTIYEKVKDTPLNIQDGDGDCAFT